MSAIDVLIITALKEEHDAARDVALATRKAGLGIDQWEEKDADTPTPYLFGRYVSPGGLSMNIALARATRIGGTATSPVVASLVERLKPRCLSMCGVCAGNPGEVALGDVIIADMVYPYDEGRQKQDDFEGDHRQTPMPDTWVRIAQDLLTDGLASFGPASAKEAKSWLLERLYAGDDPRTHPARSRYFTRNASWERHVRSLEKDGFIDRSGLKLMLTDNGRSFIEQALFYNVESPRKLPFQIKVGPIASGNVVVKDGMTWDKLKKWGVRSVLGLEMEAATIGSTAHRLSVPAWIVVKGVMDHADPRKDDRYKPFAARVSAEVLFKFLLKEITISKEASVSELERIKVQIIEYLDSLNIPTIHDTLVNISESLESLLKAMQNEERRKEHSHLHNVQLISDPRYYARLGTLELEYKNYSDAVVHLSRSLEINNQQAAVHFNLYKALLGMGKVNEAMDAYRRSISLDENLGILPAHYCITDILARGGFSTVYKAKLEGAGRMLAVKVLHGEYMRDFSVATSFIKEAEIIQELKHKSLVSLYEHGSFKGRYFAAWEYVGAPSLSQLIESRMLVPREVIKIAEKLASIIEYLHSHGIIHRDIKPQNVLVTSELDVKLIDFGIAINLSTTTTTINYAGTIAFSAPELFARAGRSSNASAPEVFAISDQISTAVDIYSLGVTIFIAITGELPKVNIEASLPNGYPFSVWTLVTRMLNADPNERPSAAFVHSVLESELRIMEETN